MPIGAIIDTSRADMYRFDNAQKLNAIMASVLYDDAGLVALKDNAIIHCLKPSDIAIPPLLPAIQKAAETGFNSTVVVVTRKGASHALELSGSVPGDDAGITRVVGEVPWASLKISDAICTKDMPCAICAAPLWGEVYAIVDPRMPSGDELDGVCSFRRFDGIAKNDSILDGCSVIVCKYCARNLCSKLPGHLQCTVVRTRVARSHDEAFAEGPRKDLLAVTQAGAAGVTPVPDMPGWFIVGGAGSEFVVKPAWSSAFSHTAIPQISSYPILNVPNLIEQK
jgi:hypothetical protein